MSATPELGRRSASATSPTTTTTTVANQPKSFSHYTTPSPTDEDSNNKPVRENLPSTNAELLSSLKEFNVDKTKFKHYGHLSLTNSQFLEKVMHMTTPEQETGLLDKERRSLLCSSTKPKVVEEEMAHVLAALPNTIEKLSLPPNTDILSELIQLQIEQERTKQSVLKKEIGDTALQLFNVAKELNVNVDLIPYLFASDSITPKGLNDQIDKLHHDPKQAINELEEKSRQAECDATRFKRKHSDTQLPSFSETAQSIIGSNIVSPLRSPNRTPALVHRRVVSDSSDSTTKGSSPANSGFLPLLFIVNSKESELNPDHLHHPSPQGQHQQQQQQQQQPYTTDVQSQLQQHLPQIQPQTSPPPVSYTGHYYTPQHIPQPPSASQAQHLPLPPAAAAHTANPPPASSKNVSNLGSPHLPKYPIVPPPHAYPQAGINFAPHQYPYYASTSPPSYNHQAYAHIGTVKSPPPPPPQQQQQQQQQQLQPSLQVSPRHQHQNTRHSSSSQTSPRPQFQHKPQPNHTTKPPVPTHQFESNDSKKIVFKSVEDEAPASKRQKNSKQTGSINFMITTPKNPPARRYNNPHKEK